MKNIFCLIVATLFIGCSGSSNVLNNYFNNTERITTRAYQIGLFVGENNPTLYDDLLEYRTKIDEYYNQDMKEKFYLLVDQGLKVLVSKYISDPMLQNIIISEIKLLASDLGLKDLNLPDIPDINALEQVDFTKAKLVIDSFMTGLKQV